MSGITPNEQSEFLFKNFLQLPTNKPGFQFFNENQLLFNTNVQAENVFTQIIPETPVFQRDDTLGHQRYPKHTFDEYWIDETDVVEKFVGLRLREVPTTNGQSYTAFVNDDPDTKKTILADTCQYNTGNGTSYNYTIKTNSGNIISLSDTRYNPIVDIKIGYITFFKDSDILEANHVSPESPPTFDFVRYRGHKGINFGELNENVVVKGTLDVCGQTHFFDTLRVDEDISTSHIDTNTLDISDMVKVHGNMFIDNDIRIGGNLFIDGSSVELHMERLDICDNIILLNQGIEQKEILGFFTSGFEIERGLSGEEPLSHFNLLYHFNNEVENRDDGVFVIGLSGDEQPVATRRYNVPDKTIAIWDGIQYQYTYDDTFTHNIDTHTLYVNNIDVSNRAMFLNGLSIDGSLNIQGNIFRDGVNILFDLEKLFDFLTKHPPAFTEDDSKTSYTNGIINLHWVKGPEYDVSYTLSTSGVDLPRIDKIHIDISSSENPSNKIRFDSVAPDVSNYQFYYGDSSGGIILNRDHQYTIRIYGENQSKDTSYNELVYTNRVFEVFENDFPDTIPVINKKGSNSRIENSTVETVLVNGIPSIRKFSVVDLSFTVEPISTKYHMRDRSSTVYADLTLSDIFAYQPQISEDICGGVDVQQFVAQDGDISATLQFSVPDIYPGQTVYEPEKVTVFSFTAVNIKGTQQIDLSFARGGGSITTWWVDASSVVLDTSGTLTSTLIEEGRTTYDICINEISRNGQDISVVDISMWEYQRNDVSDIDTHQLLFFEGRFCGAGYRSTRLGQSGTEVYRDWAEVGGPNYTDLSNAGIPDVIRDRGYDNTTPLYKWCAKRFADIVTDASGRFRTIRIDGKTREEWSNHWRVYAIQFLYATDKTETAYVDRTSWMDTRRYLSSRLAENPYIKSAIDGYGCAYSTSQIALKLNPRQDHISIVYLLIGISNEAPANESFFTKVELS